MSILRRSTHTATGILLALFVSSSNLLPPSVATADQRCFPETNQCIADAFRSYWEQNGALPVFGFPIAPAADERNRDTSQTYLTQWFERNRFELHPEQQAPYTILLGRLGDDRLRQLGRDWQTFPKASPQTAHYFAETGHAIAPEFWSYWREHGLELGDPGISEREALALFGFPLSEPITETNTSGDTVLTQWFERARFEYHPNNPEPYKVLLGLLGNEVQAGRAPHTITERALGTPAVGGKYVVWSENDNASSNTTTLHLYNLATGEQFTIPGTSANRGAATTDGTTIIWSESTSGSQQSIVGYDIPSRTTRTILVSQGNQVFNHYALADGVLYYTDEKASHRGIFSHMLIDGKEQRLSDDIGEHLVARDNILLWRTSKGCGPACPAVETLNLLRLDNGDQRILSADSSQLSGFDVSGDIVVWSRYGSGVSVYSISQGSTTTLPAPTVGVIFQQIVRGNHILWGEGSAASQQSPRWSLIDAHPTTKQTRTIITSDSGMLRPIGTDGSTLVYMEELPNGRQRLATIAIE